MNEDEQKQGNGDFSLSCVLGLVLTGAIVFLSSLFIGFEIIHAALLGVLTAWWPYVILSYVHIVYNALSKRCSNKKVNILVSFIVGMLVVYMGGVVAAGTFGLIAILTGILIAILWIIPSVLIYSIFERV